MTFEISEKAVEDIEKIWLYTAETWSVEQADRYYNLIFDEIEYIVKNPEIGEKIDHIREHYRRTKVKSHIIFYRHKDLDKTIEIIRVLHQSMDIEERIND